MDITMWTRRRARHSKGMEEEEVDQDVAVDVDGEDMVLMCVS